MNNEATIGIDFHGRELSHGFIVVFLVPFWFPGSVVKLRANVLLTFWISKKQFSSTNDRMHNSTTKKKCTDHDDDDENDEISVEFEALILPST
jgi:hypothetical protein